MQELHCLNLSSLQPVLRSFVRSGSYDEIGTPQVNQIAPQATHYDPHTSHSVLSGSLAVLRFRERGMLLLA